MNLSDYQKFTPTTAIYPGAGQGKLEELSYLALGLASEAGEVAGKIKKYQRDNFLNLGDVAKEIGDVFWYAVQLCNALGVQAEELLEINMEKLTKRKEAGTISGNGDAR